MRQRNTRPAGVVRSGADALASLGGRERIALDERFVGSRSTATCEAIGQVYSAGSGRGLSSLVFAEAARARVKQVGCDLSRRSRRIIDAAHVKGVALALETAGAAAGMR